MRKIKLGTVQVKGADVSVSDHLRNLLDAPASQGGITILAMRQRMKVIDALEKAKDAEEITLDDAEWQTLRDVMDGVQYLFPDRGLIEIDERVAQAERV